MPILRHRLTMPLRRFKKQIDALRHSDKSSVSVSQRPSRSPGQDISPTSGHVGKSRIASNWRQTKLGTRSTGLEPHSLEFFESGEERTSKTGSRRLNEPDDLSPSAESTPNFLNRQEPKVRGHPCVQCASFQKCSGCVTVKPVKSHLAGRPLALRSRVSKKRNMPKPLGFLNWITHWEARIPNAKPMGIKRNEKRSKRWGF